ncbi:MAG TPA: 3-dehydroquinate synthase II [Candidatus Bilamarchaeaceae archaeon]|nr:3-dehydroquinate synthase II [Candidatus Bilamarchaeaceae archaeon]
MKKLIIKSKDKKVIEKATSLGLETISEIDPLVTIETKKDEENAVKTALKNGKVFITCKDWKIIPLENLIAKLKGKAELGTVVKNVSETKLAVETMELGADIVVLETDNVRELESTFKYISSLSQQKALILEEVEITSIQEVGLGARSCIDTITMMNEGEGMLVGSSSSGMFLVQAEVLQNELAAPRPFRVNAGAVSMYVLSANNKTNYIEEIKAGISVLLVNRKGITRLSAVGRSKIEIRPLVLIEAKTKSGKIAKVILQNAETIRLVTEISSIPVTNLKKGDKVLVQAQEGGRHFGTLIKDETIIEQ